MNLNNTTLLVSLITFFMAYIAVVTIAGAFRAWVARCMGDDLAEQLGFLTLNPLVHIDPVGLIFLLIFNFGWGRFVPINPVAIHRPWRYAKLVLAYLSDTIAYFVSALIGITFLIAVYGIHVLYAAQSMLICIQRATHVYLVHECPTLSSLSVVVAFIVIAFVYLNIILGVLNLILNAFNFLMHLITEREYRLNQYSSLIMILVPIILIFFLSEPLRLLAIYLISYAGLLIAYALGTVLP